MLLLKSLKINKKRLKKKNFGAKKFSKELRSWKSRIRLKMSLLRSLKGIEERLKKKNFRVIKFF